MSKHHEVDLPELMQMIADQPEVLEKLEDQMGVIVSLSQQTWSGPIPSPDDLKEIDAVVPGAAKEIIDAGIDAVKIQNEINLTTAKTTNHIQRQAARYRLIALISAVALAFFFIYLGFLLIQSGRTTQGTLFAASPFVVGLIAGFVIKGN